MRELGIQNGVNLASIKRDWYILFSQPLCYHMSPCKVSHGEILLNVDSPVWLQELQYYKNEILEKLRSYGITSMRLKIGRVSHNISREKRQSTSRLKTLTADEISFMEETASQIDDEELREALQRAIKKSLIAGKVKR